MIADLTKYCHHGAFIFSRSDQLARVCNAPRFGCGIYSVYALTKEGEELVYVGSSGAMTTAGIRERDGGIYDRIVNGKQFDDVRKRSWPNMMHSQGIDRLEVHWYVTVDDNIAHIPKYVEALLIQDFYDEKKRLPRWNQEF